MGNQKEKAMRKKKEYDCCTHYKTNTYTPGVIHGFLPVEMCDNCGEIRVVINHWWQLPLHYILAPFWDGKVKLLKKKQ